MSNTSPWRTLSGHWKSNTMDHFHFVWKSVANILTITNNGTENNTNGYKPHSAHETLYVPYIKFSIKNWLSNLCETKWLTYFKWLDFPKTCTNSHIFFTFQVYVIYFHDQSSVYYHILYFDHYMTKLRKLTSVMWFLSYQKRTSFVPQNFTLS